MKNILVAFILLFANLLGHSQTLTLVSPDGLSEPYEVSTGTEVTVEWDYYEEAPTSMFSYNEDPGSNLNSDWQFSPNPLWSTLSGGIDNGDGTYSYSLTISEDTWIFGAYSSFSGYAYSNVINVALASSVILNYEDGLICSTGDTETLSLEGLFTTIEWYQNAVLIIGETALTYDATEADSYYTIADGVQSNVLVIEELSVDFTGSLNMDGTEITMTADAGMESYQWMSGTDAASMTAISGATSQSYTATLSSASVYYSVQATLGTCTIDSPAKPVSESVFEAAVINVSADTNDYNQLCDGTQITLSIDESYSIFTWYRDGNNANNNSHTYTIWGAWQNGEYHVTTSHEDWPEINVASEIIDVEYYEIIEPVLVGVDNYSTHCDGEELSIILGDEGYTYTWYYHTEYEYTEDDIIDVTDGIYSFTFSESTRITVVASFQGCEESSTLVINSYADENLYINIDNYDQQYLCIDSTAIIGKFYNIEDFTDYQWYEKDGDDWLMITGETTNSYEADQVGFYRLHATSANCATAFIQSNEIEIKDYTERSIYLWADQTEMCVGDTANLNFSAWSWTNIQWLEGEMNIGSGGYEKEFIPIIGAGSTGTTAITEFNTYIVKAKHQSCPNGLKITSEPIIIRPSVNPTITLVGDFEVNQWKEMLVDSAAFYLFCDNYPVSMYVEDNYDTYQWHEQYYQGIDDYVIGDPVDGAIDSTYATNALVQWVTLVVEQDGCIGQSDPILLDTWVFLSPAIASYNNSELCEEGDSSLMHIAFPGTWVEIEWFLDGVAIENSDNDSIWGSQPGMYTVTAYPEACPDFGYSSGVGPVVSFLEATIEEGEWETGEQFFYALPELGYYEYQWYIDGEPYENDSSTPWILYKDGLPNGVITVEITNPEPCTSLSEGILWEGLGIEDFDASSLAIYPNPTTGIINVDGLVPNTVNSIVVYNSIGKVVRSMEVHNVMLQIDLSDLPVGMFMLKIQDENGNINSYTINKL